MCLWGRICCSSLYIAGLLSSVFSMVYLSGHKYPRSPFSFLLLIVIRPNYSLLEYLKISCQIFNHSYSLCKTCITTFLHSLTLRKKSVMVCDLFGPRLCLAVFEFVLRTFQPYSYWYGGDSSGMRLNASPLFKIEEI